MKCLIRVGSLIGLLLVFAGCSQTLFLKMDPQSHFTFPDSTVTRLGRVHGEQSRTRILFFGSTDMESQVKVDAINRALAQQPGANILLNSIHLLKITEFPFGATKTYIVDGQAAKAVIVRKSAE